jgi:16S rRNA (guanine966-N2)-methyltransferase
MRIVGGVHRSRKIETPKNDAVRPTSDKVRQAVFNMLNARGAVMDVVVIDAFCGTGALGLEALSQGASYCYFFDKNKSSTDLCRTNIQNLDEAERAKVTLVDSTKLKHRANETLAANLVFLDPPYHQDLIPKAIEALLQGGWMAQECVLVLEMAKDEIFVPTGTSILNEKIYGDTKIILALFNN